MLYHLILNGINNAEDKWDSIIFGGIGTFNETMSGGTNYDGGTSVDDDGALAPI